MRGCFRFSINSWTQGFQESLSYTFVSHTSAITLKIALGMWKVGSIAARRPCEEDAKELIGLGVLVWITGSREDSAEVCQYILMIIGWRLLEIDQSGR